MIDGIRNMRRFSLRTPTTNNGENLKISADVQLGLSPDHQYISNQNSYQFCGGVKKGLNVPRLLCHRIFQIKLSRCHGMERTIICIAMTLNSLVICWMQIFYDSRSRTRARLNCRHCHDICWNFGCNFGLAVTTHYAEKP